MTRRVKEFVDIGDHASIDHLIEQLVALRDTLPADADAENPSGSDDDFREPRPSRSAPRRKGP